MNGSTDWGNQTTGVQDHGIQGCSLFGAFVSQCFKEGGKYRVILLIAIPAEKWMMSEEPGLQTGSTVTDQMNFWLRHRL